MIPDDAQRIFCIGVWLLRLTNAVWPQVIWITANGSFYAEDAYRQLALGLNRVQSLAGMVIVNVEIFEFTAVCTFANGNIDGTLVEMTEGALSTPYLCALAVQAKLPDAYGVTFDSHQRKCYGVTGAWDGTRCPSLLT